MDGVGWVFKPSMYSDSVIAQFFAWRLRSFNAPIWSNTNTFITRGTLGILLNVSTTFMLSSTHISIFYISLSQTFIFILLSIYIANLTSLHKYPIINTVLPKISLLSNITIFNKSWILYVSK